MRFVHQRRPCCECSKPRSMEFAEWCRAIVETEQATVEASRHVTLNAAVNPEGNLVLNCHFEYGPTTAYGDSVPCSPDPASKGSRSGQRGDLGPAARTRLSLPRRRHQRRRDHRRGRRALTTLIDKPVVTTGGASELNSSRRDLGQVNPLSNPVTSCRFEYGADAPIRQRCPVPGRPRVRLLAGGRGGRIVWSDAEHDLPLPPGGGNDGGTEAGADATFTTLPHTPNVDHRRSDQRHRRRRQAVGHGQPGRIGDELALRIRHDDHLRPESPAGQRGRLRRPESRRRSRLSSRRRPITSAWSPPMPAGPRAGPTRP